MRERVVMAVAVSVVAAMPGRAGGDDEPAWAGEADAHEERPALDAWNAAHERERKRLRLTTQDEYARTVVGCDPADWSKWRRGRVRVPLKWGLVIVASHGSDTRWQKLWENLRREDDARALRKHLRETPAES